MPESRRHRCYITIAWLLMPLWLWEAWHAQRDQEPEEVPPPPSTVNTVVNEIVWDGTMATCIRLVEWDRNCDISRGEERHLYIHVVDAHSLPDDPRAIAVIGDVIVREFGGRLRLHRMGANA